MRADLHGLFCRSACAYDVGLLRKNYLFSSGVDFSIFSCLKPSWSRGVEVSHSQGVVIKTGFYSVGENFFGGQFDSVRGFVGVQGELLNSLVAVDKGVSSPDVVGACFDVLARRGCIIFRLLSEASTLESMLCAGQKLGKAELFELFELFSRTLARGLYHGDLNSSNIMVSDDLGKWSLIDFECCVPLACHPALGLAMQVASFWDHRVRDILPRNFLRECLEDFIQSNFSIESSSVISEFDFYTMGRVGRVARTRRLQLACGGEPDMRKLLLNGGA